ncbi:unnamed protein product [Trifolium pratense]|uniref:Uncharacterized protein n=1 Tax=Trifolium pratense TaxID=57577 RepID=A0ACB0IJ02_TRIPR|nr:unnamed protein product [Trifolium pratense]
MERVEASSSLNESNTQTGIQGTNTDIESLYSGCCSSREGCYWCCRDGICSLHQALASAFPAAVFYADHSSPSPPSVVQSSHRNFHTGLVNLTSSLVFIMEDSEPKSAENNQQTEQVCSFFRKPVNKNIRKRTIDNEDNEDDSNNEESLMHRFKFNMTAKQQQASETLKGKGTGSEDGKLYKGMNNYTDHEAGFRREHTISGEKAGGSHGPLRASAHIRVSARFDYQPDICKDYKETGYCGYGDSCKFMHDRGDYKSGWQMEKEWEEAEKERRMRLAAEIHLWILSQQSANTTSASIVH